jgi:hypothetical protein
MARYNTVISSASVSTGTTLATPGQGVFTEITASGTTVQLPNPVLYSGSSLVFYNSSAGTSTLSSTTNGGNILGPGLSSATSQNIGSNGSAVVYSDGSNWIQVLAGGGPLAGSTLSLSGQLTSTVSTGTAPFVVASTTNVANLNASSLNGATFASPGSIGSSVAGSGAFTTLSASSTVSGSGFSTYLASPPAIGGSSAAAGSFTTLSASSTVSGSGFSTYLASPPAIGGSSAAAGTFTTLTCSSLTESSSIAYKENVAPISDALTAVLSLVGVTYDRKDGSSRNEAGLIAEQVDQILPNLVTRKSDGTIEGIHYTKLTAYLVEAVKSLKQEINELKGLK